MAANGIQLPTKPLQTYATWSTFANRAPLIRAITAYAKRPPRLVGQRLAGVSHVSATLVGMGPSAQASLMSVHHSPVPMEVFASPKTWQWALSCRTRVHVRRASLAIYAATKFARRVHVYMENAAPPAVVVTIVLALKGIKEPNASLRLTTVTTQ